MPQTVALVFLCSGIGRTFPVLTNRRSRFFDRFPEERLAAAAESARPGRRTELQTLWRRAVDQRGYHPEDLLRILGLSRDRGPIRRLLPAPASVGIGRTLVHRAVPVFVIMSPA